MRLAVVLLCFSVLLAVANVKSEEEDSFELEESSGEDQSGEYITIGGIRFDISNLNDEDLGAFLEQLDELENDESDSSEESSVSLSVANCRRSCSRIYWPVCASVDARTQTFSTDCELQNEMRCARARRAQGERGAPVIYLLHEGACRNNEISTEHL